MLIILDLKTIYCDTFEQFLGVIIAGSSSCRPVSLVLPAPYLRPRGRLAENPPYPASLGGLELLVPEVGKCSTFYSSLLSTIDSCLPTANSRSLIVNTRPLTVNSAPWLSFRALYCTLGPFTVHYRCFIVNSIPLTGNTKPLDCQKRPLLLTLKTWLSAIDPKLSTIFNRPLTVKNRPLTFVDPIVNSILLTVNSRFCNFLLLAPLSHPPSELLESPTVGRLPSNFFFLGGD